MDIDNKHLGPEFIKYARHLKSHGSYEDSFEFYLMAFQRDPNLMKDHEEEFRAILFILCDSLATTNDAEKSALFSNFYRALCLFQHNAELFNDVGKYLYKYHFYNEALRHFEKALQINHKHVNAEKNLNSVKNLLVERWHFRMLNDHIRNGYYRSAIQSSIRQNEDRVIDIGTGTGLLALYAREAGAATVLGCEGTEAMAQVAQQVVKNNHINNIKVVNKMSYDLTLSGSSKGTLLVTELFDAGLFGEHILQMLSHAWTSLLEPTARVIPNRAELFVVGVQSDQLSQKYYLSSEAKKLLNIPNMNVQVLIYDETYDCEDVHMIKDIKYITDPVSVIKVDFNDVENIQNVLERSEPYKVQLKAKENGIVDNIVGWFNLYLSDTVTVTTNPLADDRANAWEQAVYCNHLQTPLNQNDTLDLEFFVNRGKIKLNSNNHITKISAEIIRFLNDQDYMKVISNYVDIACQHFEHLGVSQLKIVDLNPFPYFGMKMLQRGALSVICWARNDEDKKFIIDVFNENKVSLTEVSIIMGDQWNEDIFRDEKYHVIFSNLLEICGDVDLQIADISSTLKSNHLHDNGLYMPHTTTLVGQLISSHWLDINNKLYDENVNKYKIAISLNKYQVTQNFCIDFNMLRYVPISEPVAICNYPEGKTYETATLSVCNNGLANAILCWYELELLPGADKISTNRCNSFIDGMLFLTNSKDSLEIGQQVAIAQYKDSEGAFKLSLIDGPNSECNYLHNTFCIHEPSE